MNQEPSQYLHLVPKPVALVTGANKGIGYQISRLLAKAGATVWLATRDSARAAEAVQQLQGAGRVDALSLDVTSEESIAAAVRVVAEKSGRLDILVNNAGIVAERRTNKAGESEAIPPSELDLAILRATYETNLFGPFAILRAFLPLLRQSAAGRIVNVSSGLGSLTQKSDPDWPYAAVNAVAYCSSKTALNAVTVAFARELKGSGIKVNAADPGYCATDLNGHSGPRTPEQGAGIAVRLALLPADGPTGGFFDENGRVPW